MSVLPSNSSHSLQFPTEILEKIVREYWALPLSTRERVLFMRDSMLVNSTWMSLYMRASCTDVHIPNSRYFLRLLNILRGDSAIYNTFAPGLHDTFCRSITFRSDHKSGPLGMSAMIQFFSENINRLPHLRRFSFELVDQTLEAVFPTCTPIPFPPNITTLEVFFYHSQSTEDALLDVQPWGLETGSLPSIHTLRVYGASAGDMGDLLQACNHVRVYDSDVSLPELRERLARGMMLKAQRFEHRMKLMSDRFAQDIAQAMLNDEIGMKRLIDEGTDEEILEAVGAHRVGDVSGILIELRSELAILLAKEQRGEVDTLARGFVEKAIRVCEKAVRKSWIRRTASRVMSKISGIRADMKSKSK
ncbi:hypothetical protein K435DRAFT_781198 [Dendrothele bispora CBS 962.96]|uniref:Uncharacterized protein n=1 Tax=Dendrothele bispora (strain CBS 962.96) TaxID=1314807 RepID=A0A4S8LN68_DENBC|nr:hypothetical protein K435DRAFT_781198 [Dendrothele bispora CBS 962.96]